MTPTVLPGAPVAAQPAIPQTAGKHLAVLELRGAKIEGDVLDAFADAVRSGAVEGLAGSGVQVMTRENMLVLLKEMGKKECTEGDCEVETARNIGADFVVSGSVVRTAATLVVALKLRVFSPVTSANFACRSFSFILFRFAISFFIVLLMVLSFGVGPARTIRSGGFP